MLFEAAAHLLALLCTIHRLVLCGSEPVKQQ